MYKLLTILQEIKTGPNLKVLVKGKRYKFIIGKYKGVYVYEGFNNGKHEFGYYTEDYGEPTWEHSIHYDNREVISKLKNKTIIPYNGK